MGWSDAGQLQSCIDDDLLEAEPLGEWGEPPGDSVDLVEREVDDRPDVQHHPVPVEPRQFGVAGSGAADGVETTGEGELDLWDGDRTTVLVAQRGQPANLRNGNQPAVGRILPGDAIVGVDVVDRWESRDLEVGQAPHVQPPGDHRMEATELAVLGESLTVGRVRRGHPVGTAAVLVGTAERQRKGCHGRIGVDSNDSNATNRRRQTGSAEARP